MRLALNLHRAHRPSSSSILIRNLRILAFESSADDTGVAIIDDTKVLTNIVLTQHVDHEKYRGIHPQIALKTHDKNLPIALQRALTESQLRVSDVDGIAFTRGPGMPGCLNIGATAARTLAAALDKPLVGVHHMQAHALTALYTTIPRPSFPFLTLLVSGGHTQLVLAYSYSHFKILATTGDDSIGNAYDKVATLLGVPWSHEHSAGASLERFALDAAEPNLSFPIPMPGKLSFSYAGLVSSVRSYILSRSSSDEAHIPRPRLTPTDPSVKHPPTPERVVARDRIRHAVGSMPLSERQRIASAFQKAAIGQLEAKVTLALGECSRMNVRPTAIVVSGGVASNSFLRKRLQTIVRNSDADEMRLLFPPPTLCTDNALMIAWTALERFRSQDYDSLSVEIRPIWSIEDIVNARS